MASNRCEQSDGGTGGRGCIGTGGLTGTGAAPAGARFVSSGRVVPFLSDRSGGTGFRDGTGAGAFRAGAGAVWLLNFGRSSDLGRLGAFSHLGLWAPAGGAGRIGAGAAAIVLTARHFANWHRRARGTTLTKARN